MIPLKDDNPTKTTPWFTIAILAANVVVFVYQVSLGVGSEELARFIHTYAFIPARFLSDPFSPAQLMTVFTAMFMHANLIHIGSNMLYLWIFGNNIEDRLGHFKFLAFYLAAGILATVAQTVFGPGVTLPNLGASGAIAGVLGAYILLFPRADVVTIIPIIIFIEIARIPAYIVIGFWFLLQLASGIQLLNVAGAAQQGGVAFFAHIGGFLGGMVLVLPLILAERMRPAGARSRGRDWR